MPTILELDETGSLKVPISTLLNAAPHSKFSAHVRGNAVVLEPLETKSQPFWKTASPQERAADILKWSRDHKDSPNLPDSAIGRDSIYE